MTMDITTLVEAVRNSNASDAFDAAMDVHAWQALRPYLSRHSLRAGECLMRQGDAASEACWLEQGNLQIHATGSSHAGSRVTVLRPGALVGEAALFADVRRGAHVEAMTPIVVWSLSAAQLDALCADAPLLAMRLLRAAAAVMVKRVQAHLQLGTPLV